MLGGSLEHRPGQGEWMPLEVRDFGAGEEDVLAGASRSPFLLDLQLHDV
jgi:hypothetical protein